VVDKKDLIREMRNRRCIKDEGIINAFNAVNRELFILPQKKDLAYCDTPLSINYGQTISQPSTVFDMLEALDLRKMDKVLEIGAGSGYASAVMSRLVKKVYGVEIIPELVKFAKENISRAGISNIEIIQSDGGRGHIEHAPYDKILVSAACDKIPRALIEQLVDGGVIVAPIGGQRGQEMVKGIKHKNSLEEQNLGSYIFVPLTGEFGQNWYGY
jgi:protein-L-isoaspartate(D-aspartate) O-methyltransferase